ncbi:MAG: hypothetical protein OEY49_04190 [Candidatus Heimdallarchaeota archaeon]|nr:hypothetical protein [Candidatus Heimdallarchaeota archaeon]
MEYFTHKFKEDLTIIQDKIQSLDYNEYSTLISNYYHKNIASKEGKLISFQYCTRLLAEGEHQKAKQLIDQLEEENELIFKLYYHLLSSIYYYGYNSPVINKELGQQHFIQSEDIFHGLKSLDKWEDGHINYLYYFTFIHSQLDKSKVLEKIQFYKNYVKSNNNRNIATLFLYNQNNVAITLRNMGLFNEAVEIYEDAIKKIKEPSYLSLLFANLSRCYWLLGNQEKMEEFAFKSLFIKKKPDDIFLTSISYNRIIDVYESTRDYYSAEKYYNELLEIVSKKGTENITWQTYENAFNFFYKWYLTEKEYSKLEKAKKLHLRLVNYYQKYPNNDGINWAITYQIALLKKIGGIREKVEAMNILEEVVKKYPQFIDPYIYLLDLYFSLLQPDDSELIEDIDSLIDKIRTIPWLKNPQFIHGFYDTQILSAKYEYYIKDDMQKSLEILHALQDKINQYDLPKLQYQIQKEIKNYEDIATKSLAINLDMMQRLELSKIMEYIDQLLKINKNK